MYSTKRIINQESCLLLQPTLIKELGKSSALFLQQLHYWISSDRPFGRFHEGRRWIYNSYTDWGQHLCLSTKTIERIVLRLKSLGVISIERLSPKKSDRTNYYTLNYDRLHEFLGTQKRDNFTLSPSQNDGINYKKSKSTSNKPQSFEEKPPIAKELLSIWNEEVGSITGQISTLTKERARFLASAFHSKFEASLEKWKSFCQSLTESDFLMGRIKKAFKATLDWVLKFETLQKLFEGQYGVPVLGKENPSDTQLINQDEPLDHPVLRKALRERVGKGAYLSWFQNTSIQEQGGVMTISFPTKFHADYAERVFKMQLEKTFYGVRLFFLWL